jgi:LmbE family N-acetylglucosaminyl deacetylase
MNLSGKEIVVFAPHPDDETFGCGGIVAKKISEEFEVFIVVLTDGRHAFSKVFGINSDPSPEELIPIRKREEIEAASILGVPVSNLCFLGFEDGTLGKHEKEAEERILEILRKHPPAEVYFPFKRDYNPDHRAAHRIVRRCIQKLGLKPAKYQYSITHWFSRVGPRIELLLDLNKNWIVEVDVSEFLDQKKRAIEVFQSQIKIMLSRQKRPVQEKSDQFLVARERFYIDKG